MLNSSGQTTMLELLVGTMLVLVVIVAIVNAFQTTFSNAQSQNRFTDLSQQSEILLQTLVRTTGLTADRNSQWEKQGTLADVNRIGLAKIPLVLSEEKVRKFQAWADNPTDYNLLLQKMGLGNFDFSVTLFVVDPDPDSSKKHSVCDSGNHDNCYTEMGFDTPAVAGDIRNFSISLERSAVLDSGSYFDEDRWVDISNGPIMVWVRVYAK